MFGCYCFVFFVKCCVKIDDGGLCFHLHLVPQHQHQHQHMSIHRPRIETTALWRIKASQNCVSFSNLQGCGEKSRSESKPSILNWETDGKSWLDCIQPQSAKPNRAWIAWFLRLLFVSAKSDKSAHLDSIQTYSFWIGFRRKWNPRKEITWKQKMETKTEVLGTFSTSHQNQKKEF